MHQPSQLLQIMALGAFCTADASLIVFLIGPEKSRPFTMAFHATIGPSIVFLFTFTNQELFFSFHFQELGFWPQRFSFARSYQTRKKHLQIRFVEGSYHLQHFLLKPLVIHCTNNGFWITDPSKICTLCTVQKLSHFLTLQLLHMGLTPSHILQCLNKKQLLLQSNY